MLTHLQTIQTGKPITFQVDASSKLTYIAI